MRARRHSCAAGRAAQAAAHRLAPEAKLLRQQAQRRVPPRLSKYIPAAVPLCCAAVLRTSCKCAVWSSGW